MNKKQNDDISKNERRLIERRKNERRKEEGVSIIIPAYNEEETIAGQIDTVLEVMNKTDWKYEIIVVDDGSTDKTAQNVDIHKVNLVREPKNRGYGAALKRGIATAQFELVAITDADQTYPSDSLPDLLKYAYEYDMVVGLRTGKNVNIPTVRKPAKWFLNVLANYLSGQKIPDLNSGLRVFKKTIVKQFIHLLPSGFSFTTSITLALLCNDYLVLYHPVDYYYRKGKSKIRPIDTYHFLILIIRSIVYYNPLKIFLPLGTIFFIVGGAKFIYDIFTVWNFSETAMMGLLTSGIIWAIGLLADIISKASIIEKLK